VLLAEWDHAPCGDHAANWVSKATWTRNFSPGIEQVCHFYSQPRLGMALSLFLFRRDFVAFTGRDTKPRGMGTGVMIKPSVVFFFAEKITTAVLAFIILCASVITASAQYSVDGLAIGTRLNFDSASYRAYKCTPSDQFRGLTWC
jgi:hypothetical protein